jgi:hypothetical protein
MLARFLEVANVCLSIVLDPPRPASVPRAVERISDYRGALASFQREFPSL